MPHGLLQRQSSYHMAPKGGGVTTQWLVRLPFNITIVHDGQDSPNVTAPGNEWDN